MAKMKTARFYIPDVDDPIDAKGKNKDTITRQVFGQSARLVKTSSPDSVFQNAVIVTNSGGSHIAGFLFDIKDYEGSFHNIIDKERVPKPKKKTVKISKGKKPTPLIVYKEPRSKNLKNGRK